MPFFVCSYLDGDLKLSDEHINYKWVDKTSYQTLDKQSFLFNVIESYFNSNQD